VSTQDERDQAIVRMLNGLGWTARDQGADVTAAVVLRAVADSWAPDGEYTADDLRALADQLDPATGDD